MAVLDVVTGAFSYTGRHVAEELLARGRRVRTLSRRPDPAHPLAARVEVMPLTIDDSLLESLRGADTLGDVVVDAAGPERFAFESVVRLIAGAVESKARIRTGRPGSRLPRRGCSACSCETSCSPAARWRR